MINVKFNGCIKLFCRFIFTTPFYICYKEILEFYVEILMIKYR